jgi:hypothetical protein
MVKNKLSTKSKYNIICLAFERLEKMESSCVQDLEREILAPGKKCEKIANDIIAHCFCCPQAITLDCPTALVWNCVGEGKSSSVLNGSPLDHLPCSPSTLPMPQRATNAAVR